MWRRNAALGATIASALVSAAAFWNKWLGLIGGAMAVTVMLIDHTTKGPAVVSFSPNDWSATPDGFELRVRRAEHGRRRPVTQVYCRQVDGSMHEVSCAVKTLPDHTVVIEVNGAMTHGEVRIT